ncbi:MAG: exodeoxyribonuclease VII small subunit [Clostridia bacterium]|jgi:exodeoxyribonuclease VII small subunit
MEKKKKSFESALTDLEKIVQNLENGELTLDESIAAFQKGIELSRYCSKELNSAEKKISIILEDEKGDIKKKNFSDKEEG